MNAATNPDEGEWMSITEAAAELGCSRTNIHRRIKNGAFKAKVVPTSEAETAWRIHRPSFEAWKAKGRWENSRRGKKIIESEPQGRTGLAIAHA